MKIYEVISDFTAFNPSTGESRTFNTGEKLTARFVTGRAEIGANNGLISNGYTIAPGNVKEVVKPVWLYPSIVAVAIVIVFVIVRKTMK